MAGVSAESNAQFVAFRRLVYNFSEQVSKEEQKTIIYIRLYQQKERYKDSTMLEVLSKLETDGAFGPSNPEGLIEIAKDIKRQDLASEVKHFIKKRSKGESKGGLSSLSAALTKKVPQPPSPALSPKHEYGGEPDSEEDLQLKATVEVTLAQATVLLQQVEKLERAVAGGKAQRQRAKEAISEAGQTAAALADRLKKARKELGLGSADTENTSMARPAAAATQGILYSGDFFFLLLEGYCRYIPWGYWICADTEYAL